MNLNLLEINFLDYIKCVEHGGNSGKWEYDKNI